MNRAKNGVDMLRGPVMKHLLMFSIPLICTNWLQMLFNAADSLVIGHWSGSSALAAVGVTFPMVMIVISLFGGLSAGITVCASNDFGAGDEKGVESTVHTAMLMAVFLGVVVLVAGRILARPVMRAMSVPDDIIDDAVMYLKIYFLCMPAQLVYDAAASSMRAGGDSKNPLKFLTIAGATNVALNMLFVIVFKWGVAGVAIATVITQYLAALLAVVYMLRLDGPCALRINKLRIESSKLRKILLIGVPAGLQSAMLAASDLPLQTAVNSLGSLAASGNAAALNIDGAIFTTMDALSQACTVFSGQNVGAGNYERIKTVLYRSMLLTVIAGLILGWTGFALRYQIIRLFLPNAPQAVEFGAQRCSIVSTSSFIYAVLVILNASLRGYGISTVPAIINIIGLCGFRFMWAKLYFPAHRNMFSLYMSYPIAWIICIIATIALYGTLTAHVKKRLAATEQKTEAD